MHGCEGELAFVNPVKGGFGKCIFTPLLCTGGTCYALPPSKMSKSIPDIKAYSNSVEQ